MNNRSRETPDRQPSLEQVVALIHNARHTYSSLHAIIHITRDAGSSATLERPLTPSPYARKRMPNRAGAMISTTQDTTIPAHQSQPQASSIVVELWVVKPWAVLSRRTWVSAGSALPVAAMLKRGDRAWICKPTGEIISNTNLDGRRPGAVGCEFVADPAPLLGVMDIQSTAATVVNGRPCFHIEATKREGTPGARRFWPGLGREDSYILAIDATYGFLMVATALAKDKVIVENEVVQLAVNEFISPDIFDEGGLARKVDRLWSPT
jgi:hypothetical protein